MVTGAGQGMGQHVPLIMPRPRSLRNPNCTMLSPRPRGHSILDTVPCGRGTQERARLFRRGLTGSVREDHRHTKLKGLLSDRSSRFTTVGEAIMHASRTLTLEL